MINVTLYGARGDGITDNSASIRRAVASLKDGGALFFPQGQYAFGQAIMLPSNIRICGDSKRTVTLLYTGNDKAFVSGDRAGKYGTGSYNITIENIAIRGANGTGTGLYITSRYLTINNTEITHFGVGIDCQFSWTNKFYNVSFFYNEVAFRGGALLNANSFVNCIFSTGQKAVTFTQGWGITFVGCQFEGYAACFSFCDQTKAAVWNLKIDGCYFENSGPCVATGPNCSFYELAFTNNIVTTHGTGPALTIDNSENYGKNTGLVANNTFLRDRPGAPEPLVHLEGPAALLFCNNNGYATPGNLEVPLLDDATRNRPDSFQFESVQTNKSGPSTSRPAGNARATGTMYFDTTLNQPLWWSGSHWVDACGREK